ncbi:MAG: hypothetical protein IKP22_11125 [Clostridia bacterium]|nr:hypothetical protein [Clostridia bacterium]
MKKATAALLAILLAALLVSASAERAVIPDTMAGFEFDRIRQVPVLYTKHSESTMSTFVSSDMTLDRVSVNMDRVYVPVPLDEGGHTFTYSTAGLKRQVGVWWSGMRPADAHLNWLDADEWPEERDALTYARRNYPQFAKYGYRADAGNGWSVEIRGIADDGKETVIEPEYHVSQAEYDGQEEMLVSLMELFSEEYPAYAALAFTVTGDSLQGWDLYAVGADSVYSFSGDDAYMAAVGNQTSIHGRDGTAHTVYARTDRDLFETDMECGGTTLTWKKNGNTGVWYVDTVEATYENSFTAKISAHYLHDLGTSLVSYDITFINEGITYTVHYAPSGKQLRASADAPFGFFVTAGSSSEWEWVNTADCTFETKGRLLPLRELFLIRYHQ